MATATYETLAPITYVENGQVRQITKAGVRVKLTQEQAADLKPWISYVSGGGLEAANLPRLEILRFATYGDFPDPGSDSYLYFDNNTESIYSWDDVTKTYVTSSGDGGPDGLTEAQIVTLVQDSGSNLRGALDTLYVAAAPTAPLGAFMAPPRGVGVDGMTVAVDTSAPSYASAKAIPWYTAGKYRCGGTLQDYFGNGLNAINGANAAEIPGWTSYEDEFYMTGRYISVYVYAVLSSDFRILVNDVAATARWQTFPAGATAYHVKIDLGAQTKATDVNRIRLLMPGTAVVQSFWMPGASDMWAAPPRFKAVITGDSYVQGPTTTSEGALFGGAVAGELAYKTGWEVWNLGQGGTGPANDGGGGNGISKYGSASRLAALAALPDMDLMVVYGGANDASYSTSVSVAASVELWNALHAARASTPLVVVGPEPGTMSGFSSTAMNALNTAMKAAAQAHPNVKAYIDQRTNNWVTGTGKVGAPVGDGSADFFMSSDGIHPSHAGFDNISDRMIKELRGVLV